MFDYLAQALYTLYLSDLIHVYTPARSLRSSSDTRILSTPNVKLKSYGQRYFAYNDLFATRTQTSTGIWLLQASFEKSSVFSQLMNKHYCSILLFPFPNY